jgi:hypothetical protein
VVKNQGFGCGSAAPIFVCVAVGIVAAGYVYYRNYEKQYRSEVERQLSAVADLKVGELVQWRKERLADGAIYFKNPSFSALVRRFFENRRTRTRSASFRIGWANTRRFTISYEQVRLLDAQGVTRLSVPDNWDRPVSPLCKVRPEVLRSGQVAHSGFLRR